MFKREEKAVFTGYDRIWTTNFVCLLVFIYSAIVKSKASEIGIPFIQEKTTTNLYSSSFVILVISILFLMFKYVFPRLRNQGKDSKYLLILLGLIGVFVYRTLDKFKIKNQSVLKITADMTPLEKEQIEHAMRMNNDGFTYSLIALLILLLVLFVAYRNTLFYGIGKNTINLTVKALLVVFSLILLMNLWSFKNSFNKDLMYSIEFERYKLFISISVLLVLVALLLILSKTKIKAPKIAFNKPVESAPIKENFNRNQGTKIALAMGLWSEKEDVSYMNSKTGKRGTYRAVTKQTKQGLELIIVDAPKSLTKKDLMRKAEEYKSELGAMVVKDLDTKYQIESNKNSQYQSFNIAFVTENPLDKAWLVKADNPIKLDEDTMTVYPYVDMDGKIGSLSFKEVSGMVIGGLPGSGKTAGMTSFMLPLALSEKVEMTVIDGKGGDDWDNFSEVADLIKYETNLIDGTNNLEVVVNRLKSICADAENRKKVLKKITGKSNFWNSKPSRQLPFKVVVFDEVQTFLNETGRSKEERESITLIHRLIAEIVTKYRSLGFCVIMATQKPSADNIPTDIRDNTSLRLSFRVATSTSEYATLGSGDELGSVSATNISQNNKGVGVIADDKGNRKYVRFGYMDEQEQEKLVSKYLTEIE